MKCAGRLETLREASRRVCKCVLQKRSDVVAVCVVGSVARGNIHEKSDVDMSVLTEQGDRPERETFEELGCSIDFVYAPVHYGKKSCVAASEADGRLMPQTSWTPLFFTTLADSCKRLRRNSRYIPKKKEGRTFFKFTMRWAGLAKPYGTTI